MSTPTLSDETPDGVPVDEDALFHGKVTLHQPAKGFGYRANVDALLLAAFAAKIGRPASLAVDLGAGVGAVGLSLLHFGAAQRVAFVERDGTAAELCRRNLAANGWAEAGAVFAGDLSRSLRALAPALLHRADLIVANPPYFSEPGRARLADAGSLGRPPAAHGSSARAEARRGDLLPFLRAGVDAMGRRSRYCLIYPATRLLSTMSEARELGLVPKRMRFVHGREDRPARVALLELALAKDGGLVVEPALVEFDGDNRPLPELSQILAGSPPMAGRGEPEGERP